MRIVIDLQGAQGINRQRGIGRYTLSLAKAIVRNRGKHEVILALNGLFPETVVPIRADFDDLLPQEDIHVWYAPGPVNSLNADNDWRRSAAELIREAFLSSLNPDVVFVPSLFEGLVDDVVTSVSTLSRNLPTAVTLHDLIPFIYPKPYLENPVVETWYKRKLDHLRRADIIISISESSRLEAIKYLGFPSELVINGSEGADSTFCVQHISSEKEAEIRAKYGLFRSFVMYGGGIDHRKNVEGLIRAYASLPKTIRAQHQLAVVCAIKPHDKIRLKYLAKKQGLVNDELVLTDFVSEDDLLALYNLCKLFVFPSWHEGFGLPVLEAMSCGGAVIGANTSSVPEVIGREDALFDPRSDEAITAKLKQVLTDDAFRVELERHGLEQAKKFSWNQSATRAIAAFEKFYKEYQRRIAIEPSPVRRPKMAYVSPLPPERSGISDYSAELLPELSRHYDIDVIVAQDSVSDSWINANCHIRSVEWFQSHADRYDRVFYHFGNSAFHKHMFNLLEEIPGVVVLHDFFLSGVVYHMDVYGFTPNSWATELYRAHGYNAVQERFHASDVGDVIWKYPCNLSTLQKAKGVIVHSENSRQLAKQWYGPYEAEDWAVIPLLRVPALERDRTKARDALSLNADDFVICCFGLLGPTKLNHRLLDAWLTSNLVKDNNCVLVFVGDISGVEYGQELLATIKRSGVAKRIRITGWVDTTTFHHYLATADIGVQLRTLSRGETAATVLDCMNYGLATIVNANGGIADLPDEAVWKLAEEFSDDHLIEALETLWQDGHRRKQLGGLARETILNHHAPRACTEKYAQAIEAIYYQEIPDQHSLIRAISELDERPKNDSELLSLAGSLARNFSMKPTQRQLFIDVSELAHGDAQSGIQRVVRSILRELLEHPPEGYRIEPVYATMEHGYRYARHFTFDFLDCPISIIVDETVDYQAGDIFLGLDLQPEIVPKHKEYYQQLKRGGVRVFFVVYDLIGILNPEFFISGARELFENWIRTIVQCDRLICISRSVAKELSEWININDIDCVAPFKVDWFHLGSEINGSAHSLGLPDNSSQVLRTLTTRPTFLMVGTLEPRKGHAQTIAAFEILWAEGSDVILVIVGKEGWMVEPLIDRLRQHPEFGKRLFWLEGTSDEYLEKVYASSACLIAGSENEGFGLPLIEAAQHGLPIISRDIPVFREISGGHAFYFNGKEPKTLSDAIKKWLALKAEGKEPQSEKISRLTWKESTEQLLQVIIPEQK